MEFSEYQKKAAQTDQRPLSEDPEERLRALMIPLLGLAGETGSLLTHFKRYLRDGEKYNFFRERIAEELGDVLWNVANVATKAELDLGRVAEINLAKIGDRWLKAVDGPAGLRRFDDGFPDAERFPERFEIAVASKEKGNGRSIVQLSYEGKGFGDHLTDNSGVDDGYRHHDVFHLAFVAVLGWSPVLRGKSFFNCKRRSNPDVDEIEDGGRAAVIDEAIVALVFAEASKTSFYDGVESVEFGVLRTIKDLTAHLEVAACSARQWEQAILTGFNVWRKLRSAQSGRIVGDLANKKLEFREE